MKHTQLLRLISDHPLAITWSKLEQISAFLQYRMYGGPAVTYDARTAPGASTVGSVALIPVVGSIAQRLSMMEDMSGGVTTSQISIAIRQAQSDPGVRAIVLEIDSPGGSVYGVQELGSEILAARGGKKIVAVANSLAASAAYWIGSACDEFVCTPSGEVGSIGVVAMHVDQSAALEQEGVKISYVHAGDNKVEGNSASPLTDSARSFIQQRVNEYYDAFVAAVSKGRGVPPSTVKSKFGQGRVFGADQAASLGMIDRVDTLQNTIARLQPRSVARRTSAQMLAEEIETQSRAI